MPSPAAITVSQLSRLIGTPSSPMLIDIRIDEDFNQNPQLIPGSFRHPFQTIEKLVGTLESKHVVIICHQGQKLSQGVTSILRDAGIFTEFLQGGYMEWHEAKLPLVSNTQLARLKNRNQDGRTVWVTRHRPKVDRIACPWLITRFIDRQALFLYVEPKEVLAVAEKFNATPFDIADVTLSHHDEQCSFDAMLNEFKLHSEPLNRLATIIRGADTGEHQLAAQSSGLQAISLGFSRMYKNDLEQLHACMPIYDALYRWCRDATDEQHSH